MKHKHCDLIKAWADGETVQAFDTALLTWVDITTYIQPSWHPEVQYRIKPRELDIKYKLMQQAVAEYKEKWITTDEIVKVPTRVTVRYTELVLKTAINIWDQIDNGNAVLGYDDIEDFPKAILEYFGVEK